MRKTKVKKVKFGELEDGVMRCIWEITNNDGSSLVDVRSVIDLLKEKNPQRDYVYTTIHTTCLRLCKKKRLEKVQIKNKYYYKTIESQDMAILKDLQVLADKYYSGDKEKTMNELKRLLC